MSGQTISGFPRGTKSSDFVNNQQSTNQFTSIWLNNYLYKGPIAVTCNYIYGLNNINARKRKN